MRIGPILCPSCNERVPRAAIRCVYCDTWLAFGSFRADRGNSAAIPGASAFGRVIYLTPADFAKLEYAATIERNPRTDPLARVLVDKLGHAAVMPARDIPSGVLTVGRSARIVSVQPTRRERIVTVRHPDEGSGAGEDVSVLSPMGLALLGLTAGESAIYRGSDGKSHTLAVERVLGEVACVVAAHKPSFSPEGGGDDPGPTAA